MVAVDLLGAVLFSEAVVICVGGEHFESVLHHFHVMQVVSQHFVGLALGESLL